MYWLKVFVTLVVCAFMVLVLLASIFGPVALAVWYGNVLWLLTYFGSLVLIGLVYITAESLEDWLHD